MMHSFRALLERTPALAPACGAVLSALSVLYSAWLWAAVVAVGAAMRYCGRRCGLWYAIGSMTVIFSCFIQQPSELPLESFYSTRSYRCEVCRCERRGNSQRLLVNLRIGSADYPVQVKVMSTEPSLQPGDSIAMRCCLRPQEAAAGTPLLNMDRKESIVACAEVAPGNIQHLSSSGSLRYLPERIGRRMRQWVARSTLSDGTCALLTTSLFGTAGGTPENIQEFRTTGLAHLLCVSGFHVALVFLLFEVLLSPLRLWFAPSWIRLAVIVPAVWLFILATGAYAPALRAGLMLTLFAMATLLERKQLSLNALCCALAIIIIADPHSVFSIGLWLGCSAVLSMIIMMPKMNAMRPGSIWWRVVSWSAASVAAYIGTVPVITAIFHAIPLMTIPANVLVVPLFPLFVWSSLGVVLLNSLGIEASWLLWLPETLNQYFNVVAGTFSAIPQSVVRNVYLSGAGTFTLLAGLVVLLCAFAQARRRPKLTLGCVGAAMMAVAFVLPQAAPAESVVMANDVCIAHRGHSATVYAFASSPDVNPYRHYLAERGVRADSIRVVLNPGALPGRHGPLHVVRNRQSVLPSADRPLYVRTNSRAVLDSLLQSDFRPPLVVLDATMTADSRRRVRSYCESRGIRVHDLWLAPLVNY